MIFGPTPLDQALYGVLAHSVRTPEGKIAKGTRLGPAEIARLRALGHDPVVVARLSPGDVGEDAAATRLAAALAGAMPPGLRLTTAHTGRVNLVATRPGLLQFDPAAVHALNLVHPSVTLATLPRYARLAPGTLVATVKIITYAVPLEALAAAEAQAAAAGFRHLPVTCVEAGLVLTQSPEDDGKLLAKGREAMALRLKRLGIRLGDSRRVAHETDALAEAIAGISGDLILILTGAATSDPEDVAPAALRRAGGTVARFGMPVDPGNLLFHGRLGSRPVIGLPGCARSPALNGADWVLERLACGIEVTDRMVAEMGVGGLLKESPVRPSPREGRDGTD